MKRACCAISMVTTMTGTATMPLRTALQNSAFIGSMGAKTRGPLPLVILGWLATAVMTLVVAAMFVTAFQGRG